MNQAPQEDNKATMGFAHKKTEKLTTAVYMLSNFFGKDEPLRAMVRERSLGILSNISAVFYNRCSDVEYALSESVAMIDEMISYFEIANVSGLISRMNFNVLKDEFVSLKDTINSMKKHGNPHAVLLTADFFTDGKLLGGGISMADKIVTANDIKDIIAPEKNVEKKIADPEVAPPQVLIKKPVETMPALFYKKDTPTPQRQNQKEHNGSIASKRKIDRSETILKILKKKDNLTVKDIAEVISDCSEKTIQRELLALVDKNVLKKVGERRWSRYLLA